MPTRKAVLIGAPGSGTSHLPGVKRDLFNMKKFLMSQKGGEWKEGEIIILESPSSVVAWNQVQNTVADYCFVYFSGHGFMPNYSRDRMIVFPDNSFSDNFLLNRSPRQLIIVDACRTFVDYGIHGLPDQQFPDRWASFDGTFTRKYFDSCIINSPIGKTIVHATKPGKYSYDSREGGKFTLSLFEMARHGNSKSGYGGISIETMVEFAPKILRREGNSQIPEIVYKTGNLKVPFVVDYNPNTAVAKSSQPLKRKTSSSSDIALLFGAVLLGAIILGSE